MREAHENLVQLLNDSNNAVIALAGKWGTGKSHLWTELRKSSTADWAKKSVTVSLFGAKSISDWHSF
jgi:DNA replication protein DnaC